MKLTVDVRDWSDGLTVITIFGLKTNFKIFLVKNSTPNLFSVSKFYTPPIMQFSRSEHGTPIL